MQCATTIKEDGAAYTVSTSSLTMEVEAVTHALRCIGSRGNSQTTHAFILTDSKRLTTSKIPGHAGVKGNDQADRLAGIATLTSGLLLVTALRYCTARVHIISFRIPMTHF